MVKLNSRFKKLSSEYIFPLIEKKIAQFKQNHPQKKIHNLGIGDVSLPLAPKIAKTICEAVTKMTSSPIGYGPSGGYPFLQKEIWKHEYEKYGLLQEEIFISEGANSDAGEIHALFDPHTLIGVTDPTYPLYRDITLLSGKPIITLPLKEEDGFIPKPPKEPVNVVYLCTPCNPTGIALNRAALEGWIFWAKKNHCLLIIDNVYHSFISSEDIPDSIYALEGGKEVAIEIRSFSKTAGFTGLRCGYMVVPKTLQFPEIHELWTKWIDIKRNGVAYPIQRGAEESFSDEGQIQLKKQIQTYQESAKLLSDVLREKNQTFFGGIHSPYIWWKAPNKLTSWEFFDQLLERSQIVTIPGRGFGISGEGYVRLSCFLSNEHAKEAHGALYHHFHTS